MSTGLGHPIRVCTNHVTVLECGCLGVDLDDLAELQSATHSGCAVCRMPARRARPFRVLRKCHRSRCYGRFHQTIYDDVHIGERLEIWQRRLRRITHLFTKAGHEGGAR